jgi:LytR cell envelope-related transcriptional attenuator
MATFPHDQFDELPDDIARVGAHRAPAKKGRGWIGFAWAALASGLLVVVGLYALSLISDRVTIDIPIFNGAPEETPTPTPTVVPTAEPLLDPATLDPARLITITVLNGTPTSELQSTVADALTAAGWPVGSEAVASARDVETTYVYYSDPANEDVARGVLAAIGTGDVRLSDAFLGAPITVVLGADYVAP